MRKYKYSLTFEAITEIEAETIKEAEAKALEMMNGVKVVRDVQQPVKNWRGDTVGVLLVQKDAEDYVRKRPYCLYWDPHNHKGTPRSGVGAE